jgi:RNA polymerase sigma-70 factor (ECF subfamily)
LAVIRSDIGWQNLFPMMTNIKQEQRGDLPSEEQVAQLVRRLADGDITALETIYRAYQKKIYKTALKYLHGDSAAAEDVTAKTFEILIDDVDKYDPAKGKLIAWLHGVAYRLAMDRYRDRAKIDQSYDLADHEETLADPDAVDPAAWLDQEMRRKALLRCLDRLPKEQRDAVIGGWLEEMTYAEVGALHDIPEGTVKSRIFNAIRNLRPCLEKRLGMGSR